MGTEGAEATRAAGGRGRRLGACLLGAALLAAACTPPRPERIPHCAWQAVLNDYVAPDPDGVNLFDYAALAAHSADAAKLAGYLAHLEGIDPRNYSRAEQMAYWINFYNALTVKVVLDAYPVDSIREIHAGVVPLTGPWGDVHASVAGDDLTLDDIEHGILRPIWRDKRIHYAAWSCPHLVATAFTAANTESLLEAAARAYVNSPRGVDVVDEDSLVLSSIYEWYPEDFGGEESVIEHLIEYADDELAALLETFEGAVDYGYDWSLNEPRH